MSNIDSLNSTCPVEALPPIKGMIDANAYHHSLTAWPTPLAYVRIENASGRPGKAHFVDRGEVEDKLAFIDGQKTRYMMTTQLGNLLVRLNSRMYNTENVSHPEDIDNLLRIMEDIKELLNGRGREELKKKDEIHRLGELEEEEKNLRKVMADVYRKDIPSLILAHTMDAEFAHNGGYDGELIYQEDVETGRVFYKRFGQSPVYLDEDDALMFRTWEWQILDAVAAAASNPARLFLLFSYDPRRYSLSDSDNWKKCLGAWKEPFAHIVGHNDSVDGIPKVWLGFCMNPSLGFRPFDEFCEHLPRFYKECEDCGIPILAHCAPGGITMHEAEYYPDNLGERITKNEERQEMISKEKLSPYKVDALSSKYCGEEPVLGSEYESLNHFYMNYGHPRSWIPVLEYFPKLRLCLAGFGGNSEWQLAEWPDNGDLSPTRQWIRCIIKLTAKYENVYADISGLNIYNEEIRSGLLEMLDLAQDDGNDGFKHLKHKLIFGSGWYLTSLTDVSDGGPSVDDWDKTWHSYGNYCREFKNLFYRADKEGGGKLWECVSYTNPWKFYGLSEEKIDKIRDELFNNSNGRGAI